MREATVAPYLFIINFVKDRVIQKAGPVNSLPYILGNLMRSEGKPQIQKKLYHL